LCVATVELRRETLADWLGVDVYHVVHERLHGFNCGAAEYLVMNDEERFFFVKERVEETLFVLPSAFLSEQTGFSCSVFESLTGSYEDINTAIKARIEATCGMGAFVTALINGEGFGPLISTYDGIEYEHDGYYIYRIV